MLKIRLHAILIGFLLATSFLAIALRGTLPQTGAHQTSGLKAVLRVEGLSLGRMIWSENFDQRDWHLSTSNTGPVQASFDHSISLNISFSKTNETQTATLSRVMNLSLAHHPTIITQVSVSQGIHYGIRFSGVSPTGQRFDAWREDSSLQHRPGLGIVEKITADLATETYLVNGQEIPTNSIITALWFYVEASPAVVGTFSLTVKSIQIYPLDPTSNGSYNVSGSFQGIIASVQAPHISNNLFQVFATFRIKGTSDLQYTLFLISQGSVVAQGYEYSLKQLTDFEVSVLLPQLISGFPPFIPNFNATALVVAAQTGNITYFSLEDVSFKFVSTPIQSASTIDENTARLAMMYYFVVLFVAPLGILVFIIKVFKPEI